MRAQISVILWRVGQSFPTFGSPEASLMRWQDSHYVGLQLYKRDSRSVVAARKHCTKRQSETLTILCVLSAHYGHLAPRYLSL